MRLHRIFGCCWHDLLGGLTSLRVVSVTWYLPSGTHFLGQFSFKSRLKTHLFPLVCNDRLHPRTVCIIFVVVVVVVVVTILLIINLNLLLVVKIPGVKNKSNK